MPPAPLAAAAILRQLLAELERGPGCTLVVTATESVDGDGGARTLTLTWHGADGEPVQPPPMTVTAPPWATPQLDMEKVLDLTAAVVGAVASIDLFQSMEQVAAVTDETPRGVSIAFALTALIEQRAAQLADVDWPADDRRRKAVTWLREQVIKREIARKAPPSAPPATQTGAPQP